MNKPKAPKKPHKNDSPPQQSYNIQKLLLFNDFEISLIQYGSEILFDGNDYLSWEKLENEGLEVIGENELTWEIINKIHDKLNCNFKINSEVNRDAYFEYWYVEYQVENINYDQELEVFNNRFDKYSEDYQKYLIELGEFEKERIKNRLAKLNEEIEKLK